MNYARTYTNVEINIRSGVDAKNYDTLITTKKLKPVELQAQKIEDMSVELKKIFNFANMRDGQLKYQIDRSNRALYLTGLIAIGAMIGATVISSLALRFYFNKKKKM